MHVNEKKIDCNDGDPSCEWEEEQNGNSKIEIDDIWRYLTELSSL